jgi:hypothetical protein
MLPVCLELWVSKGIMASNNWYFMQGLRRKTDAASLSGAMGEQGDHGIQ